jgi:hypothetical protein
LKHEFKATRRQKITLPINPLHEISRKDKYLGIDSRLSGAAGSVEWALCMDGSFITQ